MESLTFVFTYGRIDAKSKTEQGVSGPGLPIFHPELDVAHSEFGELLNVIKPSARVGDIVVCEMISVDRRF